VQGAEHFVLEYVSFYHVIVSPTLCCIQLLQHGAVQQAYHSKV
jgi:hypothetical protein